MEEGDSKQRLLPTLSLYPELLENIATKPPVDTLFLASCCTANSPSTASFFSSMMSTIDHRDDERKPSTLSLFPEVPENLSAYNKPNTSVSPTTYPTFAALSLYLPYGEPDTSSTNSNVEQPDNISSPIISQYSQNLVHDGSPVIDAEPLRVIFNNRPGTCNAWGHCAPKPFFHESVGPLLLHLLLRQGQPLINVNEDVSEFLKDQTTYAA